MEHIEPRTWLRKKTLRVKHGGFSLVEMLVVLAIITIITSIALFGQSTFNRSILLTDTAYSVALSMRQAQSLGLSSRSFITGGSAVQNAGYGVHITQSAPASYVAFADLAGSSPLANCPVGTAGTPDAKPGNCRYDSTGDGIVQTYTFSNAFTISDFCGTDSGGTRYCMGGTGLDTLDVVFLRSNTESIIAGRRISGTWTALVKAEIYLSASDGGATRGICVSRVGQVSVVQGTCP